MADAVRAKVAAGEHAPESEVIRDGLLPSWPVIGPSKTGCAAMWQPPTMRSRQTRPRR